MYTPDKAVTIATKGGWGVANSRVKLFLFPLRMMDCFEFQILVEKKPFECSKRETCCVLVLGNADVWGVKSLTRTVTLLQAVPISVRAPAGPGANRDSAAESAPSHVFIHRRSSTLAS